MHVERVVAYWSRTFNKAERNYSVTEREALAAKEALIKFQPFIEGENILLITDHSALQWAKTYENANRRLAAWGAVFSAFEPGLEILHRPGRLHSNVDPMSRMPRAPPAHISPKPNETNPTLSLSTQTNRETTPTSRRVGERLAAATTRQQIKLREEQTPKARTQASQSGGGEQDTSVRETEDPFTEKQRWEQLHKQDIPLLHLNEEWRKAFKEGYSEDSWLKPRMEQDTAPESQNPEWYAGSRIVLDEQGMVFFRDADFKPKLYIPPRLRQTILTEAHEGPATTAHAGIAKLWLRLNERFYWPKMKKDVVRFCESCDVCQKTKDDPVAKYGKLLPHSIPTFPYQSVSMDLIAGLPWSEGANAILVVVCRLTKHAQFIPTNTGLSTENFALLFIREVVRRFGVPEEIISDRDPRWTAGFWKEVAKGLKTKMSLSSSHHPQHDGQTERMNRTLETMLRAYVVTDKTSWAQWLPVLEFSYNSNVAGSTEESPFMLLYGYQPRCTLDVLMPARGGMARMDSSVFAEDLYMRRQAARQAIAKAQLDQTRYRNAKRRHLELAQGDLVLVKPHRLEWKEAKGEGRKLVQRAIGPFEVAERIGLNTYRLKLDHRYPGSPVFNVEHLKRYVQDEENKDRTRLPDTRDYTEAAEEYVVEKLVGHRRSKKSAGWEYLVRWEGYSELYDSWLSELDLRNASRLLHDYRRTHAL